MLIHFFKVVNGSCSVFLNFLIFLLIVYNSDMDYTSILFLILGFVFLIKGADLLVDGASSIALRYGVSLLVIGLTVIAFGTSTPELVVNVIASFEGEGNLGIGNILGSNIANILLVLGSTAFITVIPISRIALKVDLPVSMLAIVLLFLILGSDGGIMGWGIGVSFLFIFFVYLFYLFKIHRPSVGDDNSIKQMAKSKSLFYVALGLIGIGLGGKWVVESGVEIGRHLARTFGYENAEGLVGLTIVAIGTSLPELITSVVAAIKGKTDLAIGNVLGSNTFNLLWVLGLSTIISSFTPHPLKLDKSFYLEMVLILFSSTLIFLFAFLSKKEIHVPRPYLSRYQGFIMLILYLGYLGYLLKP